MGLTDGELSLRGPFVPADEDVPHEGALPDLYRLGFDRGAGAWQARYVTPDGLIVLLVDEDECDFHIDARPGYKASEMRAVLELARSRGLEPLDDDECEPEILEDGTVRIYLATMHPAPASAPAPVVEVAVEKSRKRAARRSTYAFALAASVAVALLMPSPLHHHYPEAVTQVFSGNEEADVSDTVPMSSNEGELSGPDSQGAPAGQAPASQPVGTQGRLGTTSRRSALWGETAGTHPDYNLHRLHRGQVEPDRLAEPHGSDRGHAPARPARKGP
ncbi:hypothetical protein SEA_ISSMI_31 [Streptomyces phage Issmi]|uniref:Uncharacterized protein n=1 Tax=Streptomyces phage Issmi TaxID=2725628 RepID=A0A6M3SY31_9CAUD|nr:hypothetical protein KGG87_gp31 [Streptomyces phage Issmi]QJD50677.1 hypothetical protein SEA_ISSMI_31 [Streptomyces phage Issmi]